MNADQSSADCKDCPSSIWNDWRLRGLRIRAELRQHKILDNEMRIVEVILDKSCGWGRATVVIPELKHFTSLTGMAEPHVHKAIAGLHLARVIRVVRVRGQITYSVREDSENWQVRPRVSRDAILQTVSLLREVNELPPLPRHQEDLPNFKDQFNTHFSGAELTKNVIPPANTHTEEILPQLS